MKILRLLAIIGIVTAGAWYYTHQQIALICVSYDLDAVQRRLVDTVDQQGHLRYSVLALKSPGTLSEQLSGHQVALAYPSRERVIQLVAATTQREGWSPQRSRSLLSLFHLSTTAEASSR